MSPFYTKDDNETVRKKPFIHSFIIKTGSNNCSINYHLKSTHFGETLQQRLQEVLIEYHFHFRDSEITNLGRESGQDLTPKMGLKGSKKG